MRLSTKFAVIFSGIVFLMGAISFYGIFTFEVDILEHEINDKLEGAATHQLDKLDRMFFERLNDLRILSTNPVFLERYRAAKQIRRELEKFLANYPQYASVSYFALDRKRIAMAGQSRRNVTHHPLTEYWPAIYEGKNQVVDISKSSSLQVPTLHLVNRVMDRKGNTAGILVARVPVDELYGLIDQKMQPSTGVTKYKVDILDQNGLILYSNHNKAAILDAIDEDFDVIRGALSPEKGVARFRYVHHPIQSSERAPEIPELMVIAREQGYRDFKGNGWVMKIQYANRDAFAPIADMSKKVAMLLLATSIFGIVAILSVLSLTVVNPIKDLNSATDRLARGELDIHVPADSFDEIGWLGKSFNDMAASLKDARSELAHAAETALARANLAERKIVSISEETQQQIGRELHDDLGQQLAGVTFMTEVLCQQLESEGHSGAANASRIADLLKEAVTKTNKLAHGLYPVEMKESGLRAMLARLASNTESIYQTTCKFACEGEITVGSPQVTTNLFRIAQEAVHNAVKHSGAAEIAIRVKTTRGVMTVEVADNGRGIGGGANLAGGGLGMYTMRYRATLIGAQLEVAGLPEGGTRIKVTVPESAV